MGNNIDGYCCGGTIDQSQKWENYLIRLNVQADTKIQKLDEEKSVPESGRLDSLFKY